MLIKTFDRAHLWFLWLMSRRPHRCSKWAMHLQTPHASVLCCGVCGKELDKK